MAKRYYDDYDNYGSRQQSSFGHPSLPPIMPVKRKDMPLTKQQMLEEQQKRLQFERKRGQLRIERVIIGIKPRAREKR